MPSEGGEGPCLHSPTQRTAALLHMLRPDRVCCHTCADRAQGLYCVKSSFSAPLVPTANMLCAVQIGTILGQRGSHQSPSAASLGGLRTADRTESANGMHGPALMRQHSRLTDLLHS